MLGVSFGSGRFKGSGLSEVLEPSNVEILSVLVLVGVGVRSDFVSSMELVCILELVRVISSVSRLDKILADSQFPLLLQISS